MEIAITVLLLIVGLVLIIKGGDFFVDAASWMAEASGIPKLIVGATVVSFATTLPELLVSIFAALDARAAEALSPGSGIGMVDMSIGNAIGSVTANLGLIMGIALVAIPMAIRRKDYMLKMILMLVAAAVTVCFSLFDNGVGMVASILLIIIFVIAMYDNIHEAVVAVKGGAKGQQLDEPVTKKAVITNVVKFLIGAVGTVAGAQLLVDNGSALASMCGVSDRVISVTIIAIGTSLPELVTTLTAIAKKQGSLSAGNIIGANIIDLTLILPVCALIYGSKLPASPTVAMVDIPACLIIGILSVVPTLITKKFSRWQGALMLAAYAVYIVLRVIVMASLVTFVTKAPFSRKTGLFYALFKSFPLDFSALCMLKCNRSVKNVIAL